MDRRDGISRKMLGAKYILVADPVQTHLRPEDQLNVVIPSRSLLDGTDIGRAWRRTGEKYKLADGIEASLFEKIREPTEEELAEYFEKFYKRYPDWRENPKASDKGF